MSFCVDLWDGFETIKEKFSLMYKQIKNFSKLLNNYIAFEKDYCKNLDNLYKEFKDLSLSTDFDFPLEKSRIKIIDSIDYELNLKKEFIKAINKDIIEKINKFLSEPKLSLDNIFFENSESTILFNKTIAKLAAKQETFHQQCKELSSYLSQIELEHNVDEKTAKIKTQKIYNKVIKAREEYLFAINETNIDREKYNSKTEESLNVLENIYKKTIEKFKGYLYDFATRKYSLLKMLYEKEKYNYETFHSNINLDQELSQFIMKYATKQFPMIKIEFCPMKSATVCKFIKSKYHDKLSDKDAQRATNSVMKYFQKYNIFPQYLIQSGVSKLTLKKSSDFFSTRRYTKTKESDLENRLTTVEDKISAKSPIEREKFIMKNVNFIKDFLNESITNNSIDIFGEKKEKENNFKLDEKKGNTAKKKTNVQLADFIPLFYNTYEGFLVYIETLIKTLSYIRSKGKFEINEDTYNLLQIVFIKILEQTPKNDYILKNILILAQTFYKKKDNEKIYLQQGIKGSEVLNFSETWHRCINYTFNFANTDKDLTNIPRKDDLIKKINKEAFATVVSYLCDMKQFCENDKVLEKVKNFYVKVYNLDEKIVNQSLEQYVKGLNKKKENSNSQKNETKNIETKTQETEKDENKENKENKENIENKNNSENKENIENKEDKENKENKENIENKENKEKKESSGNKEDKENKENNDNKEETTIEEKFENKINDVENKVSEDNNNINETNGIKE